MLKEYKTYIELKQDWLFTSDLYRELSKNGFSTRLNTLLRWERIGVLPQPKRVKFKGKEWRVYTKEEILSIINILIKLSKQTIIRRKK